MQGETQRSEQATPLVPADAFEREIPQGTLGIEEELWLADPNTMELAGGAQNILDNSPDGHFSGELIDCEIESNSGIHPDAAGVVKDMDSRRRKLLEHAERLGRILGTSGTHPVGHWRKQIIIDKPHYQRLQRKLGWLIRRNNTFALHVHYAVQGRGKALYLFNRLREYVPHLLALSVNSPFWEGEYTEMQSSRILIFSRSIHRAGLPEPIWAWEDYEKYVDFAYRSRAIHKLGEIWWDVRPHPELSTIEVRTSDAQTELWRSAALIELTAALCDVVSAEFDSGERLPIRPGREIEENKWSAQRYGLEGDFADYDTHKTVPTRKAVEELLEQLSGAVKRDLSGIERILSEPTGADRQLEVYRETGSVREVARDVAERTRASVNG